MTSSNPSQREIRAFAARVTAEDVKLSRIDLSSPQSRTLKSDLQAARAKLAQLMADDMKLYGSVLFSNPTLNAETASAQQPDQSAKQAKQLTPRQKRIRLFLAGVGAIGALAVGGLLYKKAPDMAEQFVKKYHELTETGPSIGTVQAIRKAAGNDSQVGLVRDASGESVGAAGTYGDNFAYFIPEKLLGGPQDPIKVPRALLDPETVSQYGVPQLGEQTEDGTFNFVMKKGNNLSSVAVRDGRIEEIAISPQLQQRLDHTLRFSQAPTSQGQSLGF